MADWKIGKRQSVCGPCQRPFADGEAHFSALFVRDGRLGREDRCNKCFDAVHAADLCWWKTVHQEGKRRGLRLDFDAMEHLFLSLEGREEPRLLELRYLLCLLLMRKKRLKIKRIVRTGGVEAMAMRRPRRDEELLVTVFELTSERAEELRADLVALFDGMDPDALSEEPQQPSGDESEGTESDGEEALSEESSSADEPEEATTEPDDSDVPVV